jgi:Dolichyl-phosphate-mannose-protein mannosyltransferase
MKGCNTSMRVEVAVPEIEIMECDQSLPDLRLRYFCYAALVVVLVIFAIVRIRLRNMPLERDEGEYAYAGQLMLQGGPPYHLAYNMKLPGTYAAYAVMMAAFGQTVAGIRIGMLIVLLGNTLMVFSLGRRLFGILAGTVAAASYTILANRLSTVSLDGHATHFIVLMALAGTLLLLHAIETQRTVALFGSGVFFGLAFLMKQHGILFAVFGFFFWAWSEWKQEASWRRLISRGSILTSGMILPFLITCLTIWNAGVFRQFWFWTVSYGATYEKELKFSEGWKFFRAMIPRFARPLNIFLPAGLGLTALFWNRRGREHKALILSLALFSFLAVCPGFYFRAHYFLVLLPAVALLAGLGVSAAYEYLQGRNISRAMAIIPIAFFVLSYLSALRGQRKYLFKMDSLHVHREMYAGDGFPEAMAVGDYIRDHSSSQDRVAVLGSEPEIYFYAHRRSATGYIYMYPLMEYQKFALHMQSDMIHEIEDSQPKIVVFVDTLSWYWKPDWNASEPHMNIFMWIRGYLDAHYDLMAEVPIEGAPTSLWGAPCRYYIFQRK